MKLTELCAEYNIKVTGKRLEDGSFTANGVACWPHPSSTGVPFVQSFKLEGDSFPTENDALKAALALGKKIAAAKLVA